MKKYTIILKDNVSGEEVFSKEVNAVIAGMAADEDASAILCRGTEDENILAVNLVQNEIERLMQG